jgi:hypothetical protein
MSQSIRRPFAAAALALPLVLVTCSKSTDAPKAPAVLVRAFAGDGQSGLAGWAVNVRPAVKVTDPSGTAVLGASVTFAVTGGGGSGTALTATTDPNGVAQVGSWVLGGTPGVNTMTASVTASGFSGGQYVFTDSGFAAEYTIQLQYYGNYKPTAAESAAFTSAVSKWQQIVYRHVGTPQLVNDSAGTCGAGDPAVSQTVTDLLLLASFDSIDGPGKTLAEASPCFVRTSGKGAGLTVMGVMRFDTADVASLVSGGKLNVVVLHEMGHVLGFGTLWVLGAPFPNVNCLQLPSNPPGLLQDTHFSCTGGSANAVAQFDSVGGLSYTGAGQPYGGLPVPVENCANSPYTYPTCGAGTVNGHWRTTVFGNELMVGFLPANPALSRVTVASLQDLGYTVNYAGADAYTHAFAAPPVEGGAARLPLGDDIRHGPLYAIDPAGRITLVRKRQ